MPMNKSKSEKSKRLSRGLSAWKEERSTAQIFWENEVKANLLVGKFMLACAVALGLCWLMNLLGVFAIGKKYELEIFPVGIALLLIPSIICLAFKGTKKWIKYLVMLSLVLTLSYLDIILTFNIALVIAIPVVFSCWYYSRNFTLHVSALTTVFFAISAFLGAYVNMDNPDLNFATGELPGYIQAIMLQSFLPRWIIFAIIAAACIVIAVRGRKMVLKQEIVSKSQARVETELDMANKIQAQALPIVSELPSCRSRRFDLAASMHPAREVGGDFYDFFYLDATHLVLIVADVADKGIAAALYMMMSKMVLDNKLTVCHTPGQVLEDVNRQLYKKSMKGMFVTVWLGILDLETGDLVSANAGHEYPILRHGNGDFELFRDKHGFVLGGVERMKYKETQIHLDPGDVLFVYTDGVVEANAPDESQFGEERLLSVLNRQKGTDMQTLISSVKQEIDHFANEAPQFDDITMLAFQLQELSEGNGIAVKPVMGELDSVQEYVHNTIGEKQISPARLSKIDIAIDELFSNIVKYSEADDVTVFCGVQNGQVQITFKDNGVPFNPLSTDISSAPAPRVAGGMGIRITRKLMDNVEYAYEDGRNVVTITSNGMEGEK